MVDALIHKRGNWLVTCDFTYLVYMWSVWHFMCILICFDQKITQPRYTIIPFTIQNQPFEVDLHTYFHKTRSSIGWNMHQLEFASAGIKSSIFPLNEYEWKCQLDWTYREWVFICSIFFSSLKLFVKRQVSSFIYWGGKSHAFHCFQLFRSDFGMPISRLES